jgi:hypothetical protein
MSFLNLIFKHYKKEIYGCNFQPDEHYIQWKRVLNYIDFNIAMSARKNVDYYCAIYFYFLPELTKLFTEFQCLL